MNGLSLFFKDNFLVIIVICSIASVAIQLLFGIWGIYVNREHGERSDSHKCNNWSPNDGYGGDAVGIRQRSCDNCDMHNTLVASCPSVPCSELNHQSPSKQNPIGKSEATKSQADI